MDSIQLHLRQANKSTSAALKCSARRDEALRTQRTAEPCLSKTKAHTKELQRQVCIPKSIQYMESTSTENYIHICVIYICSYLFNVTSLCCTYVCLHTLYIMYSQTSIIRSSRLRAPLSTGISFPYRWPFYHMNLCDCRSFFSTRFNLSVSVKQKTLMVMNSKQCGRNYKVLNM